MVRPKVLVGADVCVLAGRGGPFNHTMHQLSSTAAMYLGFVVRAMWVDKRLNDVLLPSGGQGLRVS